MANQDRINKLLKEGVDAARAGERERAKEILLEVTDMDSSNERAWFLLANLTNDSKEKRIYLENVLYANPNNEKAQQMLNRMGTDPVEAPTRRRIPVLYVVAGLAILWIILEALLLNTGFSRRGNATATAVALDNAQATADFITNLQLQQEATETQSALSTAQQEITDIAASATAEAVGTATPTFDPTQLTPPPTWTPTSEGGAPPTETPAAEAADTLYPPPPAEDFEGEVIVGWGGRDIDNSGFVEPRLYLLDQAGTYRNPVDARVNDITINPANGQTLVYTAYFPEIFASGLERSNINGTQTQLIEDLWSGVEFITESQQAQFSLDGTKLVFIGIAEETTPDVWLIDFSAPPLPNSSPVKRLTSDGANYAYPSISPDGSTVVAVRIDPDSINPEPDLYAIDVETLEQTQLTEDGFSITETQTTFTADGSAVIYRGSPNNTDEPGDLIRLPVGGGVAAPVIRSPQIDESNPVVSPDGNYLAYTSDETGMGNIFILEFETQETYQLTAETEDAVYPGGWYQPDVITFVEPIVPLPTPVVVNQEEGNQNDGN